MQTIEASLRLQNGSGDQKQDSESSASITGGVEGSCGMDEGAWDCFYKATIMD